VNTNRIIDILERRLVFLTNKLASNQCSHEEFLKGMGALEEVEMMIGVVKGEMYNE
jgi:hypothetical protein